MFDAYTRKSSACQETCALVSHPNTTYCHTERRPMSTSTRVCDRQKDIKRFLEFWNDSVRVFGVLKCFFWLSQLQQL